MKYCCATICTAATGVLLSLPNNGLQPSVHNKWYDIHTHSFKTWKCPNYIRIDTYRYTNIRDLHRLILVDKSSTDIDLHISNLYISLHNSTYLYIVDISNHLHIFICAHLYSYSYEFILTLWIKSTKTYLYICLYTILMSTYLYIT